MVFQRLRARYNTRELLVLSAVALQLLITISVLGVGLLAYLTRGPGSRLFPTAAYSPAEEPLTYRIQRFSGTVNHSVYQGAPNPTLDAAWEQLYNIGSSSPSDDQTGGGSMMDGIGGRQSVNDLDVFHELRCLDTIRRAFYPDYYPSLSPDDSPLSSADSGALDVGGSEWTPVDECIDSIRQSLMCMADVSTMVYVWDDSFRRNIVDFEVYHTCRDFERIQAWAKKRGGAEPG